MGQVERMQRQAQISVAQAVKASTDRRGVLGITFGGGLPGGGGGGLPRDPVIGGGGFPLVDTRGGQGGVLGGGVGNCLRLSGTARLQCLLGDQLQEFLGGRCPRLAEFFRLCTPGEEQFAPQQPGGGNGCPEGRIRVGDRCVAPGDVFPGGDPFTTPAGGRAVQGAFGLPAISPVVEQRTVRKCPEGMVLGKDNLCYPRQVLPRRNRFRKWKGDPRPPVSAADAKKLRSLDTIRGKVRKLGKQADLKVTKR